MDPTIAREFPWMEAVGLLTFAATILMILIRYGLRKPPELATTDEVRNQAAAQAAHLAALDEKFDRLEKAVHEWEKQYRSECATKHDLNALGEKVAKVESFYLTVNDNAIRAMNRAGRALREAKQIQTDMTELKHSIRDLAIKVDPIPERLGRMEENLKTLVNHIRREREI